jgi:hypothetical protein
MYIGYGNGVSPGGYRYCLMLVDRKTRKTWIYGLPDMGGNSFCDALWRFFIDAGGFPHQIQSDFDPKFVGGHVARLSALTSSDFVHLHPIANPRMDSSKATGMLPAAWPVVSLPKPN